MVPGAYACGLRASDRRKTPSLSHGHQATNVAERLALAGTPESNRGRHGDHVKVEKQNQTGTEQRCDRIPCKVLGPLLDQSFLHLIAGRRLTRHRHFCKIATRTRRARSLCLIPFSRRIIACYAGRSPTHELPDCGLWAPPLVKKAFHSSHTGISCTSFRKALHLNCKNGSVLLVQRSPMAFLLEMLLGILGLQQVHCRRGEVGQFGNLVTKALQQVQHSTWPSTGPPRKADRRLR